MASVSVIIVNFNVKYFLEQCLFSVRKAGEGLDLDIRVVDNASTDGSRTYLQHRFPEVTFYWNDRNLGFAAANNQALRDATGQYILFLNPDTILPEDGLRTCIACLDSEPDIGALGVRMMDGNGRFLRESRRAFPDPLTALFKLTGMATLFPRSPRFARYHMGHLDPRHSHDTDVLAGAFMMVRAEVLRQTGGFDEAFFMYGEDIDLSYRIRQAGWRNRYLADCTILHFKGESTRKGSLDYLRMFYGAMAIFARKHYGKRRAGLLSVGLQAGIVLRGVGSAVGQGMGSLAGRLRKRLPAGNRKNPGTLVIGSEESFEKVNNLEAWTVSAVGPMMRWAWPPGQADKTAWMDQTAAFIHAEGWQELCCCENGFGFKDCIALLEKLDGRVPVRIHARGSHSIVGSGFAFVLPPERFA